MSTSKVILRDRVPKEWIDYNGHMNDADYVRAFSLGVDKFMELVGIDAGFREAQSYTIFTLETHVLYLDEMKLDEEFEVRMQILDYDAKRIHGFLELYGKDGKRAATSEQMLMGIDQSTGRPAPFPDDIFENVKEFAANYTPDENPKEAGRVIGIKKKG
ncbi:thioesterase family protein [Virgibacillus kekensis]|uniref:Thioesterase family protein n=1 Tax=Virgibacillus kekensis TaxID=202261 RepID=A0ABV9DK87_9BACI